MNKIKICAALGFMVTGADLIINLNLYRSVFFLYCCCGWYLLGSMITVYDPKVSPQFHKRPTESALFVFTLVSFIWPAVIIGGIVNAKLDGKSRDR